MNDFRASPDGVTWTRFGPGTEYRPTAFAKADTVAGALWRICSGSGAIFSNSEIWRFDGNNAAKNADTADFLTRNGHSLIAFKNRLWLIAGMQTDPMELTRSAAAKN